MKKELFLNKSKTLKILQSCALYASKSYDNTCYKHF